MKQLSLFRNPLKLEKKLSGADLSKTQICQNLSKDFTNRTKSDIFGVDYLSTYGRETPLYDVGERLG